MGWTRESRCLFSIPTSCPLITHPDGDSCVMQYFMILLFLQLFEEFILDWLNQFTFPHSVESLPSFCIHANCGFSRFYNSHPGRYGMTGDCGFYCISIMINDTGCLLWSLLALPMSSLKKYLSDHLPILTKSFVFFLIFSCVSDVFWILTTYGLYIFSPILWDVLFILLIVSFAVYSSF